ncbi:MAG: cytochrome c [Oligoflexia bacterium]|nr:cytochrome c [Oligoflexia bacterium]
MKKIWIITLMMTAFSASFSGCGFTNEKGTSTGTGGGAPNPTSTSTSSPTPTSATFTQVNQQILQVSCVSCHSGGQAPNLSSYDGFATNTAYVVPGDAATSLIYTITESGQMPPGGPALSAAQEQLLANWINAGAPNN